MNHPRPRRLLSLLAAGLALSSLNCAGVRDTAETAPEAVAEAEEALSSVAAPLATARYAQAAVKLAGGDTLVVSGYNAAGFVGSAERYTPASGTWSPAGTLAAGRHDPNIITLSSGLVMV